MKKTSLIVALLLAAATATATPVDTATAQRVANHFWQSALGGRGTMQSVEWPYSHLYLFTAPQGYVMVSGDDCVRPVLAYSVSGALDVDDMPVQVAERVQLFEDQIVYAIEHEAQATAEDAARWQRLLSGSPVKGAEGVQPLLTTQWHQDGCYSLLCPPGTVTGCAATAQAQFMRYWNWPPIGQGSETYSMQAYGQQSADFAHTIYDWTHMPDRVTTDNTTAEQQAVATLMYHVGVSLHMQYNSPSGGGSAAAGITGQPGYPSIDNSLKDYFFYSQNMRPLFKNQGFTDASWADSLMAELDLLQPMVYCGVATQGGHGFVCDGYQWQDDQVYFHFNFGWAGRGDGYYTVDNICPPVSPTGYEDGVYFFNLSNQALLGAVPDYRMIVSDSVLNFDREGGDKPLLFSKNPMGGDWSVSCSEPWVSVDRTGVESVGQLTVQVQANNSGSERTATVTFSQDGQTLSMTVVQTYYTEADYCPLTVAMENTERRGWEGGAYLSFESPSGYVYSTATLANLQRDTVTVQVAPHDVVAVFHHGGGTDRFINYSIINQYGEHLVDVEYAHRNGGRHFIEWPCVHVGVDEWNDRQEWRLWPNPATDRLTIEAQGLQQVQLLDLTGRTLIESRQSTLDIRHLPTGMYIVRLVTDGGTYNTKIVKQ